MLKFSIFKPVKELEIKLGKDLTYKDLGEMMRLDSRTVGTFVEGSVTRVDLPSVDKVLQFFASEGMPVTPNDLFVIEPDEVQHG